MPTIADYGFLSDCQSGALVSHDGSIDWLCFPRFDSPSVFGRLLDRDAGHWRICPDCDFTQDREYVGRSLVLRTKFVCETGDLELTDGMLFEGAERGHEIGRNSPHVLLRSVRCSRGSVSVISDFSPRMEYGQTTPYLEQQDKRTVSAIGGATTLRLTADVDLVCEETRICSQFTLASGEEAVFRLGYWRTFAPNSHSADCRELLLDDAITAWHSWADAHWRDGRGYDGLYLDEVRRSALVLQGLTYAPSGAVVAALTTSLPERPGADWNWDYRFAWLRDSALMMRALWVAACPDEPEKFFRWLDKAGGQSEESKVQIVYGVEGERDLTEHSLDHLSGFEDSRPVRVGNDAWRQKQLDVVGEILDAAHLLDHRVQDWSSRIQALLRSYADLAAERWREPDAGMWEARDRERHYTSSKVMSWVALDRAVGMAHRIGASEQHVSRWIAERDAVHAAVLEEAWSESEGAFAGAFGSTHLDASVLLMPLVGFLDANEPRMRSTIEAIEAKLGAGALVRRWQDEPNGFLLTSFWLVRCLARLGQIDRARERFEALLSFGNDLGLLPEEGDPGSGLGMGNVPQAFSHVGLINAAWELTLAQRAAAGDG